MAMLVSLLTGSAAAMGYFCKSLSLPLGRHSDDGSDDVEELTRDAQRRAKWTPEEASGRAMTG